MLVVLYCVAFGGGVVLMLVACYVGGVVLC